MGLKEPNFLFHIAFGKWIQLKKNQTCTQQQLPHLPPGILFSFLEETVANFSSTLAELAQDWLSKHFL